MFADAPYWISVLVYISTDLHLDEDWAPDFPDAAWRLRTVIP